MRRAKSVDDYISNAEFWREELIRLRDVLKQTELTEEIKWGAPSYSFGGKNVVGIGAFKSYVGLWFHQGALLDDEAGVLINAQEGKTKALRQWRMQSSKDINPTLIKRYVREAIQLIKDGRRIGPQKKKRLVVPPELKTAMKNDLEIAKKYGELTPGKQREYAEYITHAKREATRLSRIKKIIPLIKRGVGLNDKYKR